jgi:regulator of replication initiation timing
MQEVRLNLYQADREFQVEIGGGGFGYRLFGPKFDGSSRLIKSVILSDRDKEEIIGYVKPDARAIEEELADYKAANASIREELRCRIKERDKLEAENELLRERVQSVMDKHFDETSGIYEDFKQALGDASHEK